MIQITTVDSQYFEFEGIRYFKNFTPVVRGNRVSIVNTYGNYIILAENVLFSEIEVNGSTYATVALLQEALLPVVYVRATSGVSSAFLELTDTPSTYTGQAGKVAKVKSDETGLEFGEGGSPTIAHNDTTGRDASNAHPISSITDLQTALDARILKAELTRTPTAGEIDTETIFSDRVVILDVGSTDTTVTILTALNNVLFKKQGTGIVTFVSGAGRTLRTLTNNLNVLTADGGMALLFADGTTDNLYVNDGEQPSLLRSGYRKGVILDTDFSTVSGTQVANVGLSEAYPDATYEIWLTFYRASGSLFSYHYVIPEASVTSTGFQLILQHGSTPTGLKIKYQTFRDE